MTKYKVLLLCGSSKFESDFKRVQQELTLRGFIIMSLGVFSKSNDSIELTPKLTSQLVDMHNQKIRMADGIYVINKNGYIGSSTQREIQYAKSLGKSVEYMEN